MPSTISKSTRTIIIVAIAAVLLIVIVWLGQDLFLKRGETIDCGKGDTRRTIDLRDFINKWGQTPYPAISWRSRATRCLPQWIPCSFNSIQVFLAP